MPGAAAADDDVDHDSCSNRKVMIMHGGPPMLRRQALQTQLFLIHNPGQDSGRDGFSCKNPKSWLPQLVVRFQPLLPWNGQGGSCFCAGGLVPVGAIGTLPCYSPRACRLSLSRTRSGTLHFVVSPAAADAFKPIFQAPRQQWSLFSLTRGTFLVGIYLEGALRGEPSQLFSLFFPSS